MEATLEVVAKIIGCADLAAGALALVMALRLVIEDNSARRAAGPLAIGAGFLAMGIYLLRWW